MSGFETSFEQEPGGGEHPSEDFEHLAQRRLRELVADDEEDQTEGGDAAGGQVLYQRYNPPVLLNVPGGGSPAAFPGKGFGPEPAVSITALAETEYR